jgi:hypothetical protein
MKARLIFILIVVILYAWMGFSFSEILKAGIP